MARLTDPELPDVFLQSVRVRFEHARARLLAAIAGLKPEELSFRPNDASNSIANLTLHLCGHLRGGYLGDRARQREDEFLAEGPFSAADLVAHAEDTFARLDRALAALRPADLLDVEHRDGPQGDMVASLVYSLAHTTEHVGQVILLAKAQRPEAVGHLWGTPVHRAAPPTPPSDG